MKGKSWKTPFALRTNFFTITLRGFIFKDFLIGETRVGGVRSIPKLCSLLSHLNFHAPSTKGASLSSPTKWICSCNHLIQTSFIAVVIAAASFFNFRLYLNKCYANFDFNRCSIFTKWCFKHQKGFRCLKPILFRNPAPN